MLLPLTACGWEKTVTIYVPIEEKHYWKGELSVTFTYRYDDRARVVGIESAWKGGSDGPYSQIDEITYDEYGTISKTVCRYVYEDESIQVEPVTTEYDPTYTDGKLTSFTDQVGKVDARVELQYDDRGQISLMRYVYEREDTTPQLVFCQWLKFVYDEDGRLIEEYQCGKSRHRTGREFTISSTIKSVEYVYDENGKLTQIHQGLFTQEGEIAPEQLEELEISPREHWYLYYDQDGKLACANEGEENTHDGSASPAYTDPNYTFDKHGNPTRVQLSENAYIEYTYQAMKVKKSDARMARQLLNSFEVMRITRGHAIADPLSYVIAYYPNYLLQIQYTSHSYLIYRPYWDAPYGG